MKKQELATRVTIPTPIKFSQTSLAEEFSSAKQILSICLQPQCPTPSCVPPPPLPGLPPTARLALPFVYLWGLFLRTLSPGHPSQLPLQLLRSLFLSVCVSLILRPLLGQTLPEIGRAP